MIKEESIPLTVNDLVLMEVLPKVQPMVIMTTAPITHSLVVVGHYGKT